MKTGGKAMRCGAKTRGPRAGRTCRSWPVHGAARCRMHGAKGGRPQTSGRYSKGALEEERKFRALLREARATVREVRRDIQPMGIETGGSDG